MQCNSNSQINADNMLSINGHVPAAVPRDWRLCSSKSKMDTDSNVKQGSVNVAQEINNCLLIYFCTAFSNLNILNIINNMYCIFRIFLNLIMHENIKINIKICTII